jgi:hypothetical protein
VRHGVIVTPAVVDGKSVGIRVCNPENVYKEEVFLNGSFGSVGCSFEGGSRSFESAKFASARAMPVSQVRQQEDERRASISLLQDHLRLSCLLPPPADSRICGLGSDAIHRAPGGHVRVSFTPNPTKW